MRLCTIAASLAILSIFVGCNKPTLKPAGAGEDAEGELRHYSEEFIDATKYHYRSEAIEVRIVSAEITGPRSQAIMNPNDVRYLVRLQIKNTSDRAKLDYIPYGLFDTKSPVTLRDGFGNNYDLMSLNKTSWFGGLGVKKNLYPGNMVEDVLAFEVPVQKADKLQLTLPGSAIGVDGEVKFHVPAMGFTAKQFDPTYHATITRMEYKQAEERKHEQRILQEKTRQAEQAQIKLEAEKKQAAEIIAKEKKLNEERERAERKKLNAEQSRIDQQKVEAEYKLAQEKAKADEKLRVTEAERLAKKKADLEKEKALAALRIVRDPAENLVVLGTSKFAIAEAKKSAEMQDKFTKTGDVIVLLKEIEVSLVKAEVDFCEVTYKTKKFYVETKFVFEKMK